MDWATIERDLVSQTEARWRPSSSSSPAKGVDSGGHSSFGNANGILSPSRGLLSSPYHKEFQVALVGSGEDERKIADGSDMGMEYVLSELANLRRVASEQAQRIATYEKLLISQGTLSETIQSDLSARITELEKMGVPQTEISKSNLYRETNEQQFIKANYDDMIYDRLGKLEEATQDLRTRLGESVVSDIGKMLDTTLDHVSSLGTLTESAKKKSDQAVLLLESLLQALTASSATDEGDFETSMIDFFAHAAKADSGNLQKKRVVHLLMDSLQKTVDKSIRDQIGPAIECLNDLFTPQLRVTESSLERKIADVDFNVKSSHAAIFSRFEKDEAALADIQQSVSNCESAVTLNFRDDRSVKDKIKSLEESVRSLQVQVGEQKELLSVVSTKHTSRQTQALDVAGAKDSVKRMQESVDSHSKSFDAMRSEIEDLKFDLLQATEKQHVRGAEAEEALTRLKEDTKDEYNSLRISYKQIQGVIEQQVGELTRKFNKMDGKVEKIKAKSEEGGNDGPGKKSGASADQLATMEETAKLLKMLEETCERLAEGQGELRQGLANVTFDFDDMKDRQKSHEKSLSAMRTAMDTLQDEIVMLAPPEGDADKDKDEEVPSTDSPNVYEGEKFYDSGKNTSAKTEDRGKAAAQDEQAEATVVDDPPDVYEGVKFVDSVKTGKVPIGTKTEAPPVTATKKSPGPSPGALRTDNLAIEGFGEDSSSDSDFASSSDDDDIIGVHPTKQRNSEEKEQVRQSPPKGPSSPSPSDVLADQLRIRADFEREEALKRVAANKAKHASPQGKGGSVSGPPVASLEQPIVSGSLLTGAGRRAGRGSATGPPLSSASASDSSKPIFETLSDVPPPPPSSQQGEGPTDASGRKDTVQCTHCLRRMPKNAIVTHSKTCELRTELCPNGCGAKVLVLKLQKHLETCKGK